MNMDVKRYDLTYYFLLGLISASSMMPAYFGSTLESAQVDSTPDTSADAQSYRRPYNLEPIAPVQLNNAWRPNAASVPSPDAAAQAVATYFKPYYQQNYTPSGTVVPRTGSDGNERTFNLSAMQGAGKVSSQLTSGVNPYQLTINSASEVRVYFIESTITSNSSCEDHGWRGALGYVDVTSTAATANPLTNYAANTHSLVFPFIDNAIARTDITTPFTDSSMTGRRTYNSSSSYNYQKDQPLLPFDYVHLGTIGVGDIKEFFYLHDIRQTSKDSVTLTTSPSSSVNPIYFTNPNRNVQEPQGVGYQHFKFYDVPGYGTLVALESTPFTTTSDKNFYDLLFLIQIRPVPEPQVYFAVGLLLIAALAVSRRKSKTKVLPWQQ